MNTSIFFGGSVLAAVIAGHCATLKEAEDLATQQTRQLKETMIIKKREFDDYEELKRVF